MPASAGLQRVTHSPAVLALTAAQALDAAFAQFGAVQRAVVVSDPASNSSRRSQPAGSPNIKPGHVMGQNQQPCLAPHLQLGDCGRATCLC